MCERGGVEEVNSTQFSCFINMFFTLGIKKANISFINIKN